MCRTGHAPLRKPDAREEGGRVVPPCVVRDREEGTRRVRFLYPQDIEPFISSQAAGGLS
jgi:hypothetical protein